jgi:hypothetical protein
MVCPRLAASARRPVMAAEHGAGTAALGRLRPVQDPPGKAPGACGQPGDHQQRGCYRQEAPVPGRPAERPGQVRAATCRLRRPALGRHPAPQGRRPHPRRTEVYPGGPPRPLPPVRGPGQPAGEQNPCHPRLGRTRPCGTVLHAHQRIVGQPDRGSVRALADLRHGRLQPPGHVVLARRLQDYCAGATPTPATPTSWPPSAANEPASAANASNAGDDPGPKLHDQNRPTFMDAALAILSLGTPIVRMFCVLASEGSH